MTVPAAISWLLGRPLAMLGVAVVLAGLGWGVVLLAGVKDAGCPKGQHSGIVTYVPITVGKVVVVTPVYGCLEGTTP